jgi:hypothetical protein
MARSRGLGDVYKRQVIDDLNKKAKEIVVVDWQDEENVKKAKSLKSEINGLFKKIDRRRIDLKKFVDAKGKIVTALIQEPMTYLDTQIAIRDKELKRQEEEIEAKIQKTINDRVALLAVEGMETQRFFLHPDACDEPTFQRMLMDAKELKDLRTLRAQQQELVDKNKDATIEAQKEEITKLRLSAGAPRIVSTIGIVDVPEAKITCHEDLINNHDVSEAVKLVSMCYPDYLTALDGILFLQQETLRLQEELEGEAF